jgi:hypothetical protein
LGEIESFPNGAAGRQAATEAALKAADPQCYAIAFYLAHDLFRHHNELHGRIWRATELVIAGHVMEPYQYDDQSTAARVKSSGKHEHYYELSKPSHWLCDCFDYRNRTAPTQTMLQRRQRNAITTQTQNTTMSKFDWRPNSWMSDLVTAVVMLATAVW